MTRLELAKSLDVKPEELDELAVVHVIDDGAECSVDVQACLRKCSDYQLK